MRTAAIIVAAGRGERAGGGLPKQYQPLMGRPVIHWSMLALVGEVDDVVVVVAPEHEDLCRSALEQAFGPTKIVHGGATRTASVRAGLAATSKADVILIHDAARPGVEFRIIRALLAKVAEGASAVAPGLAVPDALARIDGSGRILADVDRANTLRVQTPQAFRGDVIRAAYAALPHDAVMADDLAVVRVHGVEAVLIPGEHDLMKITYAEDLDMAERLMTSPMVTCVGNGVDAHRFGDGEFVTLCGVRIPHTKGLVGHSDADAGWHALVDAILGALGEGDIGAHFPPSDPKWKGADSARFLRHAVDLAENAGARIVHVDVTLLCERPKIGPHRDAMRARTAEVLGLPIERVSVKATTTERMGFLGREEGLAAQATATVERPA
ncbi:MAG: bifunctional 2-C-methyl-D-erythritol 4-phosphate cytidylyltransferase/2-C-methyl-D-erythritol 2,4-cyclodiphosphate synthase [Hyphomonadaceae bacterium]|nr:bifunctional 2-C-methyl-D-erythritol 4-phosphate cytidylyltransferase/2-C-methyl-D-erythritol 2,4-cyclodiphosphate synthase [Hyphomonadaceae bacterium]